MQPAGFRTLKGSSTFWPQPKGTKTRFFAHCPAYRPNCIFQPWLSAIMRPGVIDNLKLTHLKRKFNTSHTGLANAQKCMKCMHMSEAEVTVLHCSLCQLCNYFHSRQCLASYLLFCKGHIFQIEIQAQKNGRGQSTLHCIVVRHACLNRFSLTSYQQDLLAPQSLQ